MALEEGKSHDTDIRNHFHQDARFKGIVFTGEQEAKLMESVNELLEARVKESQEAWLKNMEEQGKKDESSDEELPEAEGEEGCVKPTRQNKAIRRAQREQRIIPDGTERSPGTVRRRESEEEKKGGAKKEEAKTAKKAEDGLAAAPVAAGGGVEAENSTTQAPSK